MMKQVRNFIIRLSITYIVFVALTLLPGIHYERQLFAIWTIALVFVILTSWLRPVLVALTLPFTIMTAGLFTFVIDGVLLLFTEWVTGLQIAGFGWAIVAAVAMSIMNIWVSSAFRRMGWLERDGEEEEEVVASLESPGCLLRILLLFGLLFGLLFSLDMSVQLALAISSLTSSLEVIFGAALVGMFLLSFGMAWLVAEGLRMSRRVAFSAVVSTLATGISVALAIWLIFSPLAISSSTPKPPVDVQYWDLPTGSHIAYVHYPAVGQSANPPIVCLHDGPGWATFDSDYEFYSQFAKDGFDVYLYDQVGTGLSGRLAKVREYGVQRDITDLDAIRQIIGAREMILIGNGAGSELAARYMSRYPERVAGVVLHSPTPMWNDNQFFYDFVPTGSPLGLITSFDTRPLFAGLMATYGPRAANKLVSQGAIGAWYTQSFAPPALVCAKDGGQAPRPSSIFNYSVNVRTARSENQAPDPRLELTDNVTPVILLVSECDYVPWEVILQYEEALPNHKVFYFQGAGHMINLTQPDAMAGVIRAFLLRKEFPMQPYTGTGNPRPILP
jgi:pimeloyl-ACP methyl ester carboxylesterase/uncharacterized membrane protein YvlD (DUF360 family)